jgi:hypothetical protein
MKNKKLLLCLLAIPLGLLVIGAVLFACLRVDRDTTRNPKKYDALMAELAEEIQFAPHGILPEKLPEGVDVQTFYYEYYNPFDANYLLYLAYRCDEATYAAETARLLALPRQEPDPAYYGMTGFRLPLLALHADARGTVYALADADNRAIVFVLFQFGNYFSDIKDYTKNVPQEHLPIGFDVGIDNPTRKEFEERGKR